MEKHIKRMEKVITLIEQELQNLDIKRFAELVKMYEALANKFKILPIRQLDDKYLDSLNNQRQQLEKIIDTIDAKFFNEMFEKGELVEVNKLLKAESILEDLLDMISHTIAKIEKIKE